MKELIFFTINEFTKDSGGTIRMKGILNALAKSNKVILISNTTNYHDFSGKIEHIYLGQNFTKKEKRIFQFLLTFLPFFIFNNVYSIFFKKIYTILEKNNLLKKQIIFFEHLDNSIAYSLKKANVISSYINDTHGIAVLEFSHKKANTIKDKIIIKLKEISSIQLDKKVFLQARGLIFVSEAMKEYFKNRKLIYDKKIFIVRDGININLYNQKIDYEKLELLRNQFSITDNSKVVFFAGNFKDLGGVIDLIKAFILTKSFYTGDLKLILIGDGECLKEAKQLAEDYKNSIFILGRQPYSELRTFQELSNIIVCPDKAHPYSEIVPHIKYFDSLISNKIVINGSFESTKEINKEERYSIDFEPSNIKDLSDKILYSIKNEEELKKKYNSNSKTIKDLYSYENTIGELNA